MARCRHDSLLLDIVRGGETEATNYVFGVPGQDEELE
jgi:hypothetical protein